MKTIVIYIIILMIGLVGGFFVNKYIDTDESKITLEKKTKKNSNMAPVNTIEAPQGGFNEEFIDTKKIEPEGIDNTIEVKGKLNFNSEKVSLVSLKVSGRIEKIYKFEGNKVTEGTLLAELFSPEYITAQNEFLIVLKTSNYINGTSRLDDSSSMIKAAERKLEIIGVSKEEIETLKTTRQPKKFYSVYAPIDGTIIERNMDKGSFVNIGDNFMKIVDVSELWFVGNIYESDYKYIHEGQEIDLQVLAFPDDVFKSHISYISPKIDPVSHVANVRSILSNRSGALLSEMFAYASINVEKKDGVLLPKSSVVFGENNYYVFIDDENGTYERYKVNTKEYKDNLVEIINYKELIGKKVVTKGAVFLNDLFNN